jgi:hypothetical protein
VTEILAPARLMNPRGIGDGGGVWTTLNALAFSRGQIPGSVGSVAANFTSRRQYYASPEGTVTNIRPIWVGWYWPGIDVAASDSYTIKAYVWTGSPEVLVGQLTFNGGNLTGTVPAGGMLQADPFTITVAAGASIYIRTVNLNSTVANFPRVVTPAGASTLGLHDGNSASDLGAGGAMSATSTATTFGPAAILGDILSKGNARSCMLIGDSLPWGLGDITAASTKGSSGHYARAMDDLMPYCKFALGGETADHYANNILTHQYVKDFLAALNYTDLVSNLGCNDLKNGGGTSVLATVLTNAYATLTGFTTATTKRVYQSTYSARTDSTDAWVTTANQTVKTDGNWAAAGSASDAIRARTYGANVIPLEVADLTMTSRNSGIWPAPPAPVTDGVHPTSTACGTLGAAIKSLLAA